MKTKLFFLPLLLTINFSFAQLNCYQQDSGLYQYYAKLENIANVSSNFAKPDFTNYTTIYGNFSSGNLSILNNNITTVSKSFPTAQTPFLQNIISIDSSSDIYSIISNSNNSISNIECRGNGALLNTRSSQIKTSEITVTENPITENSLLKIDVKIKSFEILITNSTGQIIFRNQYNETKNIKLNDLIKENGVYFVTITNSKTKESHFIKIIK